MRKLFSIPDEKETRLWNRYMSNTFEPLNKPDSTIQDAGLYQGQVGTFDVLSQTVGILLQGSLLGVGQKNVFDKINTETSKYGLRCRQLFLSSVIYALVSITLIRQLFHICALCQSALLGHNKAGLQNKPSVLLLYLNQVIMTWMVIKFNWITFFSGLLYREVIKTLQVVL